MSVDLHFIGSGISSGGSHNGFGKIVSFPAGSYPANGTFYETLTGVTYPVAEGGEFVAHPVDSTDLPVENCDVDVYHNGSGGFYNDWANATNIAYKPAGTIFWQDTNIVTGEPQEVPASSGNYYDTWFIYPNYTHDGAGSYAYNNVADTPWANGTFIYSDGSGYNLEVPSGSENYFLTGKYDTYLWNGTGGYTTLTNQGSYFSAGTQIVLVGQDTEVPSSSGNFYFSGKSVRYNWNGTGGYVNAGLVGSYFANGTFITSNESNSYYWDGTGDYYTE